MTPGRWLRCDNWLTSARPTNTSSMHASSCPLKLRYDFTNRPSTLNLHWRVQCWRVWVKCLLNSLIKTVNVGEGDKANVYRTLVCKVKIFFEWLVKRIWGFNVFLIARAKISLYCTVVKYESVMKICYCKWSKVCLSIDIWGSIGLSEFKEFHASPTLVLVSLMPCYHGYSTLYNQLELDQSVDDCCFIFN